MKRQSWAIGLIMFVLRPTPGLAEEKPPEATPQRPTFTEDTNIAENGTVELEFGFEGNRGNYDFPTTWKFTPKKSKAEVSLSYSSLMGASGKNQFTDRVTLAVRKPFWQKGRLSLAATGQVTTFSRGNTGIRAGGTVHANLSTKWVGFVANETYTHATAAAAANPEHVWDTAATLTVNLPAKLARFTPFASTISERGSGRISTVAAMYGTYLKIRPDFYVDGSVRLANISGGVRDRQLVLGFVKNLGRPEKWF